MRVVGREQEGRDLVFRGGGDIQGVWTGVLR